MDPTFIASIDIAWETLTYLLERREGWRDSVDSSEPTRELARDLRAARDTWIGFVFTIIALNMLILAWQVAMALTGTSV